MLFFVGAVVVFNIALEPKRNQISEVGEIALDKTPITKIQKYYHLNRDVNSLALAGTNKNKKYYFVYLPKTKKAYLYQNTKGVTEAQVINVFLKDHKDRKITDVNLGWYKKRPVWEISYTKTNKKIGYVIYNFEDGEELSYIDNL